MLQYSNMSYRIRGITPLRRIFRNNNPKSGIAIRTRPDFDGTQEPRTFLELGCLHEPVCLRFSLQQIQYLQLAGAVMYLYVRTTRTHLSLLHTIIHDVIAASCIYGLWSGSTPMVQYVWPITWNLQHLTLIFCLLIPLTYHLLVLQMCRLGY